MRSTEGTRASAGSAQEESRLEVVSGAARVDHRDGHVAEPGLADRVEVEVGALDDPVRGQRPGARMDRRRDGLGGRATIGGVELDAEIALRAARIVARRQDDAADGANACSWTTKAAASTVDGADSK